MFTLAEFLTTVLRSRLAHAIVGGLIFSVIFAFGLNSTVNAQSQSAALVIDDVTITEKFETEDGIAHKAQVTISNTSLTEFTGLQRVDFTIDNGERQLAFIVTQIDGDASITFTFGFNLHPGDHTIAVILGDSEVSQSLSVNGADIELRIIEHRLKRGGQLNWSSR